MKDIRLYKRGDVWWMDYFARGKRVRQSTGFANRKDAARFAASINQAAKMSTFDQAVEVLKMIYGEAVEGQLKLDDAWTVYLKVATAVGKANVADATLARRKNVLDRLIAWISKERPKITFVEQIDGATAAAFAEHLAKEGLKTKTRANLIGELSSMWKLIEKGSKNVRNPWGSLCPRITDGRRGEAFSREQERSVLEAARKVGKDWWEVCQVMRLTGLRYGDVARLTWAEVGADAIRLKPHKTQRHGIGVVLPMIPELKSVIDGIQRRGDFVFPLHSELYGNRGRMSRAVLNFREVLDAAGVKGDGYTIHSWRHTAATRLAEAGADIETRKRILGHTEDATARRYDHDEHLAEVAAALENAAK